MSSHPRTRRSLRRSVAVVAALVALGVSACGVSADRDSTATASFAAGLDTSRWGTQAPKDATSAKVAVTAGISGIPGSPDLEVKASGAYDTEAGTAHLVLDLGDLDALLGSTSGAPKLPADAGKVEVVVVDDALYVKSSLLASMGADSSKPWLKLDASSLGDLGTLTPKGGGEGAAPAGGPTSIMGLLEEYGTDVVDVGTEQLRGVPTRHVRTTLDLEKLMALGKDALSKQAPELGDLSGQLDSAMGQLTSSLSIPVDVWIDQDHRVRQVTVQADLSKSPTGARGSADLSKADISATIELYDYDEPVDITAPPADQVGTLDLGSMFDDLMGGSGLGGLGGGLGGN